MQLNLHVPRDRERLLGQLEVAARRLGRPKSQVVLDALEQWLEMQGGGAERMDGTLDLPKLHLGVITPFRRADIYLGDEEGADS